MRDQQARKPEGSEQVSELVADPSPGDRVECAKRLVKQQHPWLARERPCERDPLTLAARKLLWLDGGQVRDPEALEQVGTLATRGECDVAGDREVGEQAVVLRQVADVAVLGAEVPFARGVEPALVPERDPARAGLLEAGDRAQQRCLAGAGRADERDRFRADAQARAKIERSPCEDDVDVEAFQYANSSFVEIRITALTIINSTPIAIA